MTRRIGIFVFYQEFGVVEDYITFLLESMEPILDQLVVVINGCLRAEGLNKLKKFTDRIYMRENIGYDGGAYKEVILNYIPKQELQEYDELVMFNDTFYGPFVPWNFVFGTFEHIETDFWGLSQWLSGSSYTQDYPYFPEHVQSYFLVVRKRMLLDERFYKFWSQMDLPMSYDEAIQNFEVAFTTYFKNNNFQFKTWLEVTGGNRYLEPGEVVYIAHAGDLVVNSSFPIMKKKAISLVGFGQVLEVLKFVKRNCTYYIDWIEDGIARYEHTLFPYLNIEKFYFEHKKIYIFGYGKWGHGLENYFRYKGWKIEAFVVTNKELNIEYLMELDELEMDEEDGLIVALGKEQCRQVLPILNRRLNGRDILSPKEEG